MQNARTTVASHSMPNTRKHVRSPADSAAASGWDFSQVGKDPT
jgi:hypothetical protein